MDPRLGVALCALTIGCSSTVEFPFALHIDTRFDAEQVCLIDEAVRRWEEATGVVDIRLGGSSDDSHEVRRGSECDKRNIGLKPDLAGWVDGNPGGRIWIFPHLIDGRADVFLTVAMHELGHHFGLQHTSNKSALMYWQANSTCITRDDLDAFCDLYDCAGLRAPECEPVPDWCVGGKQ